VERFYLTKEELSAIERKKFTIERLQVVKDLFHFSCCAFGKHPFMLEPATPVGDRTALPAMIIPA